MGLDMYLTGERTLKKPRNGDMQMKGEEYDLGYWRKHPNLHGYIVENFADEDDCRPVYLSSEDLRAIRDAVEQEKLPHTHGFFFGQSDGSEKANDLQLLDAALAWVEADDPDGYRSVYYQASW